MEIAGHQFSSCSTTCSLRPGLALLKSNNKSVSFQSNNGIFIGTIHSQTINKLKAKHWIITSLAAVQAVASTEKPSTDSAEERWLLVPVGDGDSRHIGFKVEMPAAFEITSNEVTIGRVPDKADVVIPVATGTRVELSFMNTCRYIKGGKLFVTDLDSTNGTFIGEKRLKSGVPTLASSGSYVIFGDIHLAMFHVSKLEKVEAADEPVQE